METKDTFELDTEIVQPLELRRWVSDGHPLWYVLFKQSFHEGEKEHTYRRALACFRIRVPPDENNDQALERWPL